MARQRTEDSVLVPLTSRRLNMLRMRDIEGREKLRKKLCELQMKKTPEIKYLLKVLLYVRSFCGSQN